MSRRWLFLIPVVLLLNAWTVTGRIAEVCDDPLDHWATYVIDPNRPTRAVFIRAADLDGDTYPDLATGAWWYENPHAASGSWQRQVIGAPLAQVALLWDIDGDTDIDILGTATSDATRPWLGNAFVWAENDGSGSFTVHDHLDAGGGDFLQGIAVGAFRPGVTEAVLSWHNGAPLQALTVPADPQTDQWKIRPFSTTTQSEELSAGNIDRSGGVDLLLGTKWLENNGALSGWSAHALFATTASPDRNRLALINNDARLDAVVGYEAISKPGLLAWYEQPATATAAWTEHAIATVTGPMSLDVGDMDGDGDPDVVVGEHNLAAPATARMLVFENTDGAGGRWFRHVVDTGYEHHDGAQTVDLDKDGDLDIFSIGWGLKKVLVYENLGCDEPDPGELTDGVILTSSTSGGAVAGVAFGDKDILAYDITAGTWQMVFDGSDVGLGAADVDAFDRVDGETLYLSFDAPVAALPGLSGPVDDSDVVAFHGTLGPATSGTFNWIMDGSDVGLTTDGEDIDALALLGDGRLLVSTLGGASTGAGNTADEDVLAFTPSQTGPTTAGTWALYFDGSDVGLSASSEDLSGLWAEPDGATLYLSFAVAWAVLGASGDDDDLLRCALESSGATTRCAFSGPVWNGGKHGFGAEKVDGIEVITP